VCCVLCVLCGVLQVRVGRAEVNLLRHGAHSATSLVATMQALGLRKPAAAPGVRGLGKVCLWDQQPGAGVASGAASTGIAKKHRLRASRGLTLA
jgi:hypothetical protein